MTRIRAFVLPNGTHAVLIQELRPHGRNGHVWHTIIGKEIK